jgi:hypothetical protein
MEQATAQATAQAPQAELTTLLKAGYPLLSVRTQEPLRLTVEAAQAAQAAGRRTFQWDAILGAREIGGEFDEPVAATQIPEEAAKQPGSLWVLHNYHFAINMEMVIQSIQNWLPHYEANGITLLIVSPGCTIPAELEREVRWFKFGLPGRDELGAILDALVQAKEAEGFPQMDEATRGRAVDNLQGLTFSEARAAISWGMVKDKAIIPATLGIVKGGMVEQSAGLTFSTFTEDFKSLVGNDRMKSWTLNRFNRRLAARGKLPLPFRGMIILGKPGNGKSHFAKALGNEVGWPTVIFDLSRVFAGLVGQSEENMERALAILDAIAPCIVFIDEVEKALAGAGGGTGTNETTIRVAMKFLQWLQDHTSLCFVVATCNDIMQLAAASDGAFIRPGRWDGIFFVDNPEPVQAREILDMYLEGYTGTPLKDYPEIPSLKDYSGAEIRQIAIETAYQGGDLGAAYKFVKPMARTNKEALDKLTKWAAGRTEPAHIPSEAATGRAIDLN